MRVIGIIGGMSWESSLEYYRILNEEVMRRLGGNHSARLVMSSVDFQEYADAMAAGRWEAVEAGLVAEAERLAAAGAEAIVIATNTMHLFADSVAEASGLPVLHIADAAGEEIRRSGSRRVGLLGTKHSMEKGFYVDRLKERFGIEAVVPPPDLRERINDIIFDELCRGVFAEPSKRELLGAIDGLLASGIEGVVLGCTELPLVVKQADVAVPVWDTLRLHALKAADFMLG